MNHVSAQESSCCTAEDYPAPVIAIVNLMLDWDLPVLEISSDELAEWLEVSVDDARRALLELGALPGAEVLMPAEPHALVRAALDVDRCPLTAPRPGALRLVHSRDGSAEREAITAPRAIRWTGEVAAEELRRRA
ncbi:hypothetical protein [Nocardia sp. CA-120079]|uniref:hypothetical protein n=1 Tax=Nocardia sp. CA-120079 TaxID=3239974 RepID=UPI003D96226E